MRFFYSLFSIVFNKMTYSTLNRFLFVPLPDFDYFLFVPGAAVALLSYFHDTLAFTILLGVHINDTRSFISIASVLLCGLTAVADLLVIIESLILFPQQLISHCYLLVNFHDVSHSPLSEAQRVEQSLNAFLILLFEFLADPQLESRVK